MAIFFGLSGTGKTTLSADPERQLIGDDEHGWGDAGVFNFEGGCYAKVIRLSAEAEPEIYETTRHVRDAARERRHRRGRPARPRQRGEDREHARRLQPRGDLELAAGEARRASVERRLPDRRRLRRHAADRAAHDAQARLPLPLRLHRAARRHRDRRHRAGPTFSPCFGGPFLPQPPAVYARLLRGKLAEHQPTVWLVNTGWTGGPAGDGGHRMPIARPGRCCTPRSRARSTAPRCASTPSSASRCRSRCPASTGLLDPRSTWEDPAAYDAKARELAAIFRENFAQFADVDPEVAAAGPAE